MQMNITEVLWITFVSMSIVFLTLTLLMYLMKASSWIIQALEQRYLAATKYQKTNKKEELITTKAIFEQDEYGRVAALVALSQASQHYPHKRFEIISIEKKVS